MKLYYSGTSPFVRKVNVVAMELGLAGNIERIITNPWESEDALISNNPLSKIPTLVTDDGMILFDSPVICEYLDSLHALQPIIPAEGEARWQALRTQALADGLLDAGILRFLEAKRTEDFRPDWDEMQKAAVVRALQQLNSECTEWGAYPDIGQISAGCALGWLDFRFPHEEWRKDHAVLAGWYEEFAQRPSMRASKPVLPA